MAINPANYHEDGEAFGWNMIMNRMAFKRFVNSLDPPWLRRQGKRLSRLGREWEVETVSPTDYFVPKINPFMRAKVLQLVEPIGCSGVAWKGESAGPNGSWS
jgi:hypothetical protein